MDDHFQQQDDEGIDRKPPPPAAAAAAAKKGPVKKRTRRKKSKKPKDMPRRPLSAYNIFFREERGRMLKAIEDGTDALEDGQSQGLFSAMGKSIAKKWKALSKEEMVKYTDAASEDLKRYRREMDEYQVIVTQRCRTDEENPKVADSPTRDEDDGAAASMAAARNAVRANHFDVPSADFQQRGLGDYRDNPMRSARPDVGPYSSGAGMGLGLPSQYGGMGGGSLLSGQMGRSQGKFSDMGPASGLMDSGSLLETSSQLGISAPQLVQYLQEEALKRHLHRERQLQLQILLQQQQQQQQQPGALGQLQDDYQGGISNLLMQQQQQPSRMSQPLLQQMLMQQQMSDMNSNGGRNPADGMGGGQQQQQQQPMGRGLDGSGGGQSGGDGSNHQQGSSQYGGGGMDQEAGGGLHQEDDRQDI